MKSFVLALMMLSFVFVGTASAQQQAPYSVPKNAQFPVICSVGTLKILNRLTPEEKAKNQDKLYAMNVALGRMKEAIKRTGYNPMTAPPGYLNAFATKAYQKYPNLGKKCFDVYGR